MICRTFTNIGYQWMNPVDLIIAFLFFSLATDYYHSSVYNLVAIKIDSKTLLRKYMNLRQLGLKTSSS